MFKQIVGAGLCLSVAIIAPVAPAFADIAAYNAAVKAGDYKAAAAETATIWSGFDKTSPDAAGVAREFGFANLVAGDFSAARDFGKFLKEKGASLKIPDDQPATSAVRLATADYRIDMKSARDELMTALQARANQPGLDNFSVLAAETLYRGDWSEGAWSKVLKSTATAATLLDRGGPGFKGRAHRARIAGAAAEFLGSPSAQDILAMETVYEAIVADINATTDRISARRSVGTCMKLEPGSTRLRRPCHPSVGRPARTFLSASSAMSSNSQTIEFS